jgi:DNA-binding MarR family transcriptional regulator
MNRHIAHANGGGGILPTTEAIRGLLNRKVLAAYRHRAAMARRLGLSESEVTALAYLAQGAMTPGQLGDRLQLTSGGVTALLHRLERAGHIDRRPHPRDKRSVILTASPEILEAAADCHAQLVADTDAVADRLSPRERAIVARYLAEIADLSERNAEVLIARVEEEEAPADDDLLHIWA